MVGDVYMAEIGGKLKQTQQQRLGDVMGGRVKWKIKGSLGEMIDGMG